LKNKQQEKYVEQEEELLGQRGLVENQQEETHKTTRTDR